MNTKIKEIKQEIQRIEQEIPRILKDIYSIDESLRIHEKSLIKIIRQLMISKPESKIDDNFVSQLRLKLIAESNSLPALRSIKTMFNFSLFRKLAFAGTGALIILLAVFLGLRENRINLPIPVTNNQVSNIKDAGDNAFGKIVLANQDQINRAAASSETLTQMPQAMGLGGSGAAVKDSTGAGTSMIYPPYGYATYNFVYKGGDFEVGDPKQAVYRRTAGNNVSQDLVNVISRMKLGPVDLASFQNLKINTLEISEDKEFGYSLYLDFRQNTFSINMNWEKWPLRENFTAPAEKPKDEEIIAIADRFLADYGIDLSGYGQAEVVNDNLVYIMKSETGIAAPVDSASESGEVTSMPIRYTESVSVVYPLIIDGQTFYDQSGKKYGITVSVDFRYKRVTNAYNININGFEKSFYDVETDVNKIIDFAQEGGIYGNYGYYYYDSPTGAKTVDVELGAPKKGLVIMWQYEEGKGPGYELFVPSFLFPIVSELPQPNYRGDYVIVPLVGEMMKNPDGGPVPMPMKGGSETVPGL